jgi:hypothetical protein
MTSTQAQWDPAPRRSAIFDPAILMADRRVWHPLNFDLSEMGIPFDVRSVPMLPPEMVTALETLHVAERLNSPEMRIRYTNDSVRIHLSDILYGERASLAHALRLCQSSCDDGAVELAAIQAREEARHVSAFSLYIARLWGEPTSPTPVLAEFLETVARSESLAKEVVGMQVLVEGLAMGIFTALERELRDPLGRELIRFVMADEAGHLKAGVLWLQRALAGVSPAERDDLETWTARQFKRLSRGLFSPTQRPAQFAAFGLDPRQAAREVSAHQRDHSTRSATDGIFSTVAKAVQRAGLISARTGHAYSIASQDVVYES